VKRVVRRFAVLLCTCLVPLVLCSCESPRAKESPSAVSGSVPEMQFVRIPEGSFDMGFGADASSDQAPVHRVTISRPFELERTEEAQEFIQQLNRLDPEKGYRLPTEAEWEYACRAGSTERGAGDLDGNAWWHHNSEDQTHPVGMKRQNPWGLYDMIGNVWEYTADWKDSYPAGSVTDPAGPAHGYYKVSRGGSWFDVGRAANFVFRASPAPSDRGNSQGFRLARTAAH